MAITSITPEQSIRRKARYLATRIKETPDLELKFDYHSLTALLAHAPGSVEPYLKNILARPINQGQISQCIFALLDQELSEMKVKDVVGSLVNYAAPIDRGNAIKTIMGALCHPNSGICPHQEIILSIVSKSDIEKSGECGVFNSVLNTLVSRSESSLKDADEFEGTRRQALSLFQSMDKLGIPIKKEGFISPSPLIKACMLLDQEESLNDIPNVARLVIGLMVQIWPNWKEDISTPRISPQCLKVIMEDPTVRRSLLADIASSPSPLSTFRPPRI